MDSEIREKEGRVRRVNFIEGRRPGDGCFLRGWRRGRAPSALKGSKGKFALNAADSFL